MSSFTSSSTFVEDSVEGKLLPSGYLVLIWHAHLLRFTAGWSNPLWELLEFSVDRETAQIMTLVQSTLRSAPVADLRRSLVDDPIIATAPFPVLWQARIRRWVRVLWLLARSMLDFFVCPPSPF